MYPWKISCYLPRVPSPGAPSCCCWQTNLVPCQILWSHGQAALTFEFFEIHLHGQKRQKLVRIRKMCMIRELFEKYSIRTSTLASGLMWEVWLNISQIAPKPSSNMQFLSISDHRWLFQHSLIISPLSLFLASGL